VHDRPGLAEDAAVARGRGGRGRRRGGRGAASGGRRKESQSAGLQGARQSDTQRIHRGGSSDFSPHAPTIAFSSPDAISLADRGGTLFSRGRQRPWRRKTEALSALSSR